MLANYFGPNSIKVTSAELSFEDAVAQATGLLVLDQKATDDYVDEVLTSLEELGPYFVVAPQIAIAHSKPSTSVVATGMALLKLKSPCNSGSANDPVSLVFAFCSVNADDHLQLLAEFGEKLSSDSVMNSLLNASAESVIAEILFENQV